MICDSRRRDWKKLSLSLHRWWWCRYTRWLKKDHSLWSWYITSVCVYVCALVAIPFRSLIIILVAFGPYVLSVCLSPSTSPSFSTMFLILNYDFHHIRPCFTFPVWDEGKSGRGIWITRWWWVSEWGTPGSLLLPILLAAEQPQQIESRAYSVIRYMTASSPLPVQLWGNERTSCASTSGSCFMWLISPIHDHCSIMLACQCIHLLLYYGGL